MKLKRQGLFNKKKTISEISYLVNKYGNDIKNFTVISNGMKTPLNKLSLKNYFDLVRKIKYNKDIKPIEIVLRPAFILLGKNIGLDCKKKSILMASYFKCNRIKYRYVVSSQRPDKRIHHIYTQIKVYDSWKNTDPTYPKNKIFENRPYTKTEYYNAEG